MAEALAVVNPIHFASYGSYCTVASIRVECAWRNRVAGRIFLSYRREDSGGQAGRLSDRLVREFGRDNLFLDVDSISLGENFVKKLIAEVAACDVLIALIGPRWLDIRNERNERRIDQPNDFVRIEIAAALQRDVPVIPALVDGAAIPKQELLPDDVKDLALRNGIELRHASFHADVDRLIRELRKIVAPRVPLRGRWRKIGLTLIIAAVIAACSYLAYNVYSRDQLAPSLAFLWGGGTKKVTPEKIVSDNRGAVGLLTVKWETTNGELREIKGVCFAVSRGGYMLTSSRLIPDDQDRANVQLSVTFGSLLLFPAKADIIKIDKETNLAVIRLANNFPIPVKISNEQIPLAETVTILGYEGNSGLVSTIGRVAVSLPMGYIALDANLSAGFGGSPVFNETGSVVAVVLHRQVDGQPVRAISIRFAQPLLSMLP